MGRRCIGGARFAVVALAAVASLAIAPSALAHATLVATTPTDGSTVASAPATVTITFDEQVETALGSIRVVDANARRVDTGTLSRPTPEMVSVALRPNLPNGTYTVSWRVISADSHPASGAFVFGIGVTPTTTTTTAPSASAGVLTSVRQSFRVVRFLHYAALLVLAGGVVALAAFLGVASTAVRRALWGIVAGTALLLALTSAAGIVLEGAEAGGFGIRDALDWPVARAVIGTRFGEVWTWQAIAALGLVVLAFASRHREDLSLRVASLALAGALMITPALTGHAAVSGRLARVADIAHVAAASVWIGGLTLLTVAVALAGDARRSLCASAVPRFSRLAVASVVVLLAGGITNATIQIGPLDGLWTTTYGKLILVKSALVLALIGFGAYNRHHVPDLNLRVATAELAVMALVVGATAVLAGEPPAKAASVVASGPYSTETPIGPYDLNFVLTPARVGVNAAHLYVLDKTGHNVPLDEVRIAATLPAAGIAPLRFTGRPGGPGHYIVPGIKLPIAGTWRLRIDVRKGDFDLYSATVTAPVR